MDEKYMYFTPTCGNIFIVLCTFTSNSVCWYVHLSMVILAYLVDTFFLEKSECVAVVNVFFETEHLPV